MGKIFVIGLGCNPENDLSKKAHSALYECDVILCNRRIQPFLSEYKDKIILSEEKAVAERCRKSKQFALEGKNVALVCMGDPGVYGIAALAFEEIQDSEITVVVVPGITACLSGAALLGAPLMQDFAVITLSEGLQSVDATLSKLRTALASNFVVVLYGVSNEHASLPKAIEIIRELRLPHTAIGIATDIGGSGQSVEVLRLCDLMCDCITQRSILFVGNDSTYLKSNRMITPLK